jgi:hypothetical protein
MHIISKTRREVLTEQPKNITIDLYALPRSVPLLPGNSAPDALGEMSFFADGLERRGWEVYRCAPEPGR